MTIYTSPMCSCVICHKEYSQKGIGTHFIHMHTNNRRKISNKGNKKFFLSCSCIICKKELFTSVLQKHCNSHNQLPNKKCPKCNNNHIKSGEYCSRKCANTRNHSVETKNKTSITFKLKQNSNYDIIRDKKFNLEYCKVTFKICKFCNNSFIKSDYLNNKCLKSHCSKTCHSKTLSKNSRSNPKICVKRSKDEIKLFELCNSHFNKVTSNENIFNYWDADILIYDTKTAILWNGPWHYKEMNFGGHSLKQVQNRDAIKIKEIETLGWKAVIFEDRYYTPEEAFKTLI